MKITKMLENLLREDLSEDKAIEVLELYGYPTEVSKKVLNTSYSSYFGFGNDDFIIISGQDFKDFTTDLINEFIGIMPDKFDTYFNRDKLIEDAINDNTVLIQTQEFLEKHGMKVTSIADVIPADNMYILDLL